MDQITHEIRLAHWKEIVEACNNRPAVLSAYTKLRGKVANTERR